MKKIKDSFANPNIKVPFFTPSLSNSDKKAVLDALNGKLLTNGPRLIKFENKFKKFVNSKYAVGVSNATAALHLSLKVLGVGKNDEVIVPDMTFVATANAVLLAGAKPVLADVEEDTMNISPESILSSLSNKTKAIMPVHFAGRSCNMTKIMKIAKSHKLFIVEDCAHAIGTKFKNKHVGTFGDCGCFSFYPTKNITTLEGGMVISNNKKIARDTSIARNHGITHSLTERYSKGFPWEYEIDEAGYNYRLDEIRATLGLSQLEKIQTMNKKRRNAFKYYNKFLKDIPGVSIPSEVDLKNHACHLYVLRILKNEFPISRNQFFKKLLSAGIRTTIHYKPLNKFSIYKKLGLKRDNLKNSNKLYDEIISLPLYPDIQKQEQDFVINTISSIQKNS
mgnify:CR=1 FL=1|tara:strand:+ start:26636 stop:27814 length:1179 start_codon:yes stop_codon:yes gene_type:complete